MNLSKRLNLIMTKAQSMSSVLCGVALLILLAGAFGARAYAQANTADVVGTVADPSGAVLPHASVTITNIDTQISRKAQAGDAGEYTVTLLPPGRYSVLIDMPGFKTFRVENLKLSSGDQFAWMARWSLAPPRRRWK